MTEVPITKKPVHWFAKQNQLAYKTLEAYF